VVNVIFTGLYRYSPQITNLTLNERIRKIRDNGVDNIYWYVWRGHTNKEVEAQGVKIVEIDEPYPHIKGIEGRQRQIFNIKRALADFSPDDVVLKLRWDLDFNDALIQNITSPEYFDKIKNGLIGNKVWTGFYSIQAMFTPADKAFAGYKKDLDKLINFEYNIAGAPANNYISHDGMMLMPIFIENNPEVCDLIELDNPDPWSLMFKDEHCSNDRYINAWAYSYYLFDKYFKTGPLGSCYFKRGDMSRWPFSFVNYNNFIHNYDTITGKAPKMGLYPKYRVYDDIFVERLVGGHYKDDFAQSLYQAMKENKENWEACGV